MNGVEKWDKAVMNYFYQNSVLQHILDTESNVVITATGPAVQCGPKYSRSSASSSMTKQKRLKRVVL